MVIRRARALTLRGQLGIFVRTTLGPRDGEAFSSEADGKSTGRFSFVELHGSAFEQLAKVLRRRLQQVEAHQHKTAIAVRRWQPAELD